MVLQDLGYGDTSTRGNWQSQGGGRQPAERRAERGNGSSRFQEVTDIDAERLATGLGWFSIALGLAEALAPRGVARLIGVRDDDRTVNVLRAYGLRELASGIGILTQPRPAGWEWSRVAGDALDLASLGKAMSSNDNERSRLAAATAAVVGITILDVLCAERLSNGDGRDHQAREGGLLPRLVGSAATQQGIHVVKTITVNKPAEELYRAWRDFEKLPQFMYYLESVRVTGERRSHWQAKAPLGMTVEWDAEITEDRPNERVAWRSLPGAPVPNSGSVSFERGPGGRGTTVRVELHYDPPGGVLGATFAKLLGREPGQEVQEDLRRFKQLMEIGEVVQSDATVKGWGSAQPPADARI